jgi:hypothetical protein
MIKQFKGLVQSNEIFHFVLCATISVFILCLVPKLGNKLYFLIVGFHFNLGSIIVVV